MTSMPRILCTVRALHPFHSPEQSSLSFEKGDFIDVLAQLESGWWDGWCNGSRGWFPSNYVEMVSVNPELADSVRPTASTSSMQPKEERLPDVPEGGEPSSYFYYHNNGTEKRIVNGSIEDSEDDDDDRERFVDAYDQQQQRAHERGASVDSAAVSISNAKDDHEEHDSVEHIMSQWVERVTPQGRKYFCNLVTQETTWDREEIDPTTGRLRRNPEQEDSSDDETTTRNKLTPDDMPSIICNSSLISSSVTDRSEPLTWQRLSSDIALAIHQLNQSAQQNMREHFNAHAALVVEAIRMMLFAAGLMERDSHHTQDQALRNPHRAVMASLSKLVLSARIASEAPETGGSSEAVFKLQKDAGDVLAAVRNFVTVCQQRQVSVEYLSPRFIADKDDAQSCTGIQINETNVGDDASSITVTGTSSSVMTPDDEVRTMATSVTNSSGSAAAGPPSSNNNNSNKTKYPLNQDLLMNLQTHTNQIYGSTQSLGATIAHAVEVQHEENLVGGGTYEDENARVQAVMLFRALSEQICRYLGIVDNITVEGMPLPGLRNFKIEKQYLYDAFGGLFGAIQTLSNPDSPLSTCASNIEDALANVEDALSHIMYCVEQLVEQRRIWLSRRGTSDTKDLLSAPSPRKVGGDGTESIWDNESDIMDDTATTLSVPSPRSARQLRQQRQPSVGSSHGGLRAPFSDVSNSTISGRKVAPSMKSDESESAWYLGYDHDENDIVFGSDGSVKGGTLAALVERLTLHDTLDTSFIANFLLTYRSFCTTEEFVSMLEKRYTLTAPKDLTPSELERWTERKQKLIRLRVFNVMKNWLENYYNEEDEFILDRLEFFTNTVIRDTSSFSADQLIRLIQKRRELDADDGLKKLVPNALEGPEPIIPKNLSTNITLLDTDPLELARQLSLVDFKLYSSIRPIECLNKAWSRDDADLAVHVKQSIDYCNRLTSWVTGSILEHDEVKKRVTVIKHWTQVADRCRLLNNYNTCMAILSAFDNSAVGRLRRTWEFVGNRIHQTLNSIRKLMGSNRNFTEYREMIHSVNPPCIPFLGIYLQDLTFIEDGNPDYLPKSNNMINFAKRQKTAEVIREIKQFQSVPYKLQEVPLIQEFIKTQLGSSLDVETLYERSLEIEPRTTAAAAEAARLLEMIN